MGKGSFLGVWMVLAVAILAGKSSRGQPEEALISAWEKANERAEEAKANQAGDGKHHHDNTDSWSDMASEKFSKGLGYDDKEEMKKAAENVKDKAGEAALKTTKRINNVASDATKYATEKAKYASEKAEDVYDKAKETVGEAWEYGRDKAENAFEEAKKEVGEKYEAAKKSMKKGAKANYEAAKEKASEATGNLGAKMRDQTSEL